MRRRLALLAAGLLAVLPTAAAAAPREKKKGGGLSYLQLSTMTATVMRRDGRRGVLTVEAGLDIPENALRERAEYSRPRLRAAYVQLLQVYAAGLTPGTAPNPDAIGHEMQRETDRVLGKPGARLLLGTVMIN